MIKNIENLSVKSFILAIKNGHFHLTKIHALSGKFSLIELQKALTLAAFYEKEDIIK